MQCFNHPPSAAIGLCKHCYKGLCASCATDLGYGLACTNSHEADVEAVRAMVTRASQLQTVNRKNKYLSPVFSAGFGAVFLGYGLLNPSRVSSFMVLLGGFLLAYAVLLFFIVRKAYSDRAGA